MLCCEPCLLPLIIRDLSQTGIYHSKDGCYYQGWAFQLTSAFCSLGASQPQINFQTYAYLSIANQFYLNQETGFHLCKAGLCLFLLHLFRSGLTPCTLKEQSGPYFGSEGDIIPLAITACGREACEAVFIPVSTSIYLLNLSSERLESFFLAAVMLHLLFPGHTA